MDYWSSVNLKPDRNAALCGGQFPDLQENSNGSLNIKQDSTYGNSADECIYWRLNQLTILKLLLIIDGYAILAK